jgi:hypothetical protein
MKRNILLIAFAFAFLFIQSCSKKDASAPASLQTNSSQTTGLATALVKPVAGQYTVTKYIEESITKTPIFKGYVFTFRNDGVLVARFNGTAYFGTWEMEDNNTKMDIDIEGTDALKELDRGWNVVFITNTKISLNQDGGRRVLVFTIKQ